MKINRLVCMIFFTVCVCSTFATQRMNTPNVKSHIRFLLELEAPATFDSKTLSFLIKLQNISDDVIEYSTISPPNFTVIVFNQDGLNLSRNVETQEVNYPRNKPRQSYKLAPKEMVTFRRAVNLELYKSNFSDDTQLFFKAFSALRIKGAERGVAIDSERLFHKNFSTPALVEKFRLRDEKRKQYLLKSK
ncbi:hypothetical protein [Flocculibacter collagenilyticus]|uniref:hypothetical protein n=1 Tax=Flocculibacter collagenilyticus TaxID=2744479 RepID=UPI0018F6BC89|nr:hypothetical protein [Flocculibacter collagenilyticus]